MSFEKGTWVQSIHNGAVGEITGSGTVGDHQTYWINFVDEETGKIYVSLLRKESMIQIAIPTEPIFVPKVEPPKKKEVKPPTFVQKDLFKRTA